MGVLLLCMVAAGKGIDSGKALGGERGAAGKSGAKTGAVTGGLQDQMLSAARGAAAGVKNAAAGVKSAATGVKTAANGLLAGVGVDGGSSSAIEPGLQQKQVPFLSPCSTKQPKIGSTQYC